MLHTYRKGEIALEAPYVIDCGLKESTARNWTSPGGEEAKRFVAELLPKDTKILLKTARSEDKYGSFVTDVFVPDKAGNLQYLNNLLLERNLAVRMED